MNYPLDIFSSSFFRALVLFTGCFVQPFVSLFGSDLLSALVMQERIQEIYNNSKSAVVRVKATKEVKSDGKTRKLLKMGSGFFVSKDGHVLTTGLLKDPDRIWIEHESAFYLAENVGRDPLCNVSMIKVSELPKSFSHIPLSDYDTEKIVGSYLVGLTCALDFAVGPTLGLLQSKEFAFGKRLFPTMMLRTSLALGPGEVGGPVFDLQGRFIGMCHAALPDLKSSFIIPANACIRIRDDLILSGKVDYGWFGISTSRKLNDTSHFNIVVSSIIKGSPASKTELKSGDIIKSIDKKEVKKQGDLAFASFYARPGTIVEMEVVREEKVIKIPIKVTSRPIINTTNDELIADVNRISPSVSSENENNSTEDPEKVGNF